MATTFEGLLSLSITDLKQLGFLRPNEKNGGGVVWKREDGTRRASIYIETDTRQIPVVRFVYDHGGKVSDYYTPLRFQPSNLNNGGYYYFCCPVTGRSCRKLYLVGGRFVSRWAFRALYEKQTWSKRERADLMAVIRDWAEYERLANQRHRKRYYRGKLTPYGRKLAKYEIIAERLLRFYKDEAKHGIERRLSYMAHFGQYYGVSQP